MPAFSLQFPSTDLWIGAMRECLAKLASFPADSDLERVEGLLRLAHTRRAAPIREIWKTATSERDLDRGLAACELLGEPNGGILLTAIAAFFAETKDAAAFDRVWPLAAESRPHAKARGELHHAALAQCAAFRPEVLAEIARFDGAGAALQILARSAPAETVAAAFKALEDAGLDQDFEKALTGPLAFAGRVELAVACLPLIHQRIVEPRENLPDYIREPSLRCDFLRSNAVRGLTRQRRFDEALQFLASYENKRLQFSDTIDTYVKMGDLLKARDLIVEAKDDDCVMITAFEPLAYALGEAGEIEAVLDVADATASCHSKSSAAELTKDALECAIKAGHTSAVEAVLNRVNPPRIRKKLEEQIARVSKKTSPQSIRARAELWLKGSEARMPEAIRLLEQALSDAKPAERVFLLCALMRAHAKAGSDSDVQRLHAQVKDEVQSIKARARRIDATQQAAAALVAVGMRREALHIMDATGEALQLGDKQEMRDIVHGFVGACETLGVTQRLANLTEEERHETGFGMFIEDQLSWQQTTSDDLDKTIARAKASGDFHTTIDMLCAQQKYADAASVLRHAPKPRQFASEESRLVREAAERGQDAVVLDVLATIGSPIAGEHPPGTPADILLRSYLVRSAFGLSGGKLENLVHALAVPLDRDVRETSNAALTFAEHGDFEDYNSPSNGAFRIKQQGSWEAARAFAAGLLREEHSAFPSEFLLDLAKFGISNGLPAATVEDVLRECCDRLHVAGRHGYDARKLLADLIYIHLQGTKVPGVEEKAREVIAASKTRPVHTEHTIHCHAVLGEWDEALALLPVTCCISNYRSTDSSFERSYPWRILKVIPLPVLRANATDAVTDVPSAWFIAAAFAARQEKRAAGFIAKLLGARKDTRLEIIQLLKDSISAIPQAPR